MDGPMCWCVRSHRFLPLSAHTQLLLPSPFTPQDAEIVLKHLPYVQKHKSMRIFHDSFVTSVAFIEDCAKFFEVHHTDSPLPR